MRPLLVMFIKLQATSEGVAGLGASGETGEVLHGLKKLEGNCAIQ